MDYMSKPALMGKLTSSEEQKKIKAMTGEEAYNEFLMLVNGAEKADVAPVRRGRWLTWEEQFPEQTPKKKNGLGVFCDQCHNHADNMTDWCPNCGAWMGGTQPQREDV